MKYPLEKEYPKKIRVRNVWYEIRFVNKFRGQPLTVGLHQGPQRLIRIKRQKPKKMFDTYVHEVVHSFEYQYGFELKHKHVYKLAKAVCQYLKKNHLKPSKSLSKRKRVKTNKRSSLPLRLQDHPLHLIAWPKHLINMW